MKIAILLTFFFVNAVFAFERATISSISELSSFIDLNLKTESSEDVLVVFDFDNTLMAMNQDLGSDQWYNWQSSLIGKPAVKDAIAKNKDELFEITYKLLALSGMHTVETNTASVVKKIQSKKFKSVILTSRGPLYRNDTELELLHADLDFKISSFGPEKGYPGTFLPEGITKPRDISYMDGIIMGAGQNKGKILKVILDKTGAKFKTIIFMDDSIKNIENFEEQNFGEAKVFTFYYTHEESQVLKFDKTKAKTKSQWKKLKKILDQIFIET